MVADDAEVVGGVEDIIQETSGKPVIDKKWGSHLRSYGRGTRERPLTVYMN